MKRILLRGLATATAGAAFVALSPVGLTQAATLVVPNNLAATEGNFQGGFVSMFPSRFQQVYAASQFGSQPVQISQITLRPNGANVEPVDFTIENIQINISTTSKEPDALSLTFADNIGIDETQVFSGSLVASTANSGPVGGPKNFDIVIDFENPFFYNPNSGNLLLDIKKFTPETTNIIFDSEATFGDSVSTIVAVGDANATTANPLFTPNSPGAVTQFTLTLIPEPSSMLGTLAFGVFGGCFLLRRKLKSA